MGEVIENKVVQMAFDNTKFEKGVQATLNILGRLTNTLNGLNSIKYNLLGVADQVKAVTFDPINAQLQIGVGKAMALTAALTGVYNITDQIYGTMTSLIRSMTFDQITNGFSRYEQVVNSTQTILAASRKEGESMEKAMERVGDVQERLLWFADETSYDAQGMLSVISQFTSHGIELEDAATAMEGIANWAATAGVNATNATMAMQQLAQTLGKGFVQRQDWMSITTQNMDTSKFKELVIQAAVAKGELKKVGNEIKTLDGTMNVTAANMEQSLSKNWFTKEVLMDVLTRYGEANAIIKKIQDDNPGMLASEAVQIAKNDAQYAEYMLSIEAFEMAQVARTWTDAYESVQTATATKISEIFKVIFGDYLKAKDLWTDIAEKLYDIFVTPLDTVMQAFQKWGDNKGFKGSERIWKSFQTVFEAIEETVSQIWTIFSKLFGIEAEKAEERAEGWIDLIAKKLEIVTSRIQVAAVKFSKFMESLRANEKIWSNLEAFLRGIRIGFDLLRQVADAFRKKVLDPLLGRAEDSIEKVSGLGFSFEQFMLDIQSLVDETDLFNTVFDKTYGLLDKVMTIVFDFIDKLNDLITLIKGSNSDKDGKGGFFTNLLSSAEEAEGPIDKIFAVVETFLDYLDMGLTTFSPLISDILNMISDLFKDIGQTISDLLPDIEQFVTMFFGMFMNTAKLYEESGQEFTLAKVLQIIGNSIKDFMTKLGKGTIDNFIYLMSSLRLELVEWKNTFLGEGTIFEIIGKNFQLIVEAVAVILALKGSFEELLEFKWDGLFGKLLWGETLTNLTDQLYYDALAKMFASVADGILAIAAALFVISLIDVNKMDESMKILTQLAAIMVLVVGAVETLTAIFSNLTEGGSGSKGFFSQLTNFKGAMKDVGDVIATGLDTFSMGMKYEAIAKMVSAVTWGFIKLAAAMWILSKIPNLNEIMPVMWGLAGIIVVLFAISALLTGDTSAGFASGIKGNKGILGSLKTSKFSFANKATGIAEGALSMVLIAFAIGKLAKALQTVAKIPEDDLFRAEGAIVIMSSIVIVLMLFSTAMSKWLGDGEGKGKSIIAIGRMVSAFGIAILLIAVSLSLLASSKHIENLPEAAKWLGIAFGALSAVALVFALLSKAIKPEQVASISALTGLILIMSISLVAVAGALVLLTTVDDPKKLITAAETLGGVFVAFFLLIAASAFIKPQQVFSVAGSLAIICVSMLALIPLMKACMEIDDTGMENLKKIAIGLGAFLGLVVTASVIIASNPQLSAAIGYMYAISGVLVVLSVTGLIASVGILALAAAFTIFVEALEKLQWLNGEKIKENMLNVASFFPEFMVILWQGLADSLTVIMLQPLDFIREIITKIFLAIINAAAAALPDLIKFIKEAVVNVIDMARTVLPLIFDFLNEFGALLTEKVTAGTIMILFAVFEGLVEGFEKIAPRIPEIINRFADTLIANGKDIIEAFGRLAEPLGQMISGLLEHITTVIANSSEQIRSLVRTLLTLIFDIVNDFGVMLTDKVTAGTIRITMAIFGGLIEGFLTGIPEFIDQTAELIIEFINAMADVLDEHGEDFLDAIDRLMKSIVDFVYSAVVHWADDGGIFFEGGVQIVSGITRGITSRLQAVKKAAFTLGDWVRNGFCEILGIKSPSKVFEMFGNFIIQGLLKGIDAHKDTVLNSLGSFGQKLKDTFGDKISNFGGLEDVLGGMLNSIDVDIIPNLDLTNLKGSLHEITDLFGEQQLEGMVGVNGFNIDDISNGMDSVSLTNGLDSLNGKMDQLIKVQEFNLEKPQDVNVVLEGDTSKFFKAIRKENTKRTRATGYNALMGAQA